MAKRKVPISTVFDIKEFKSKLDEIEFTDIVYTTKKVGSSYYIVGISYDVTHGVGNVSFYKKHGTSRALAEAMVEEVNIRLKDGKLSLTERHRKFLYGDEK